MLRFLLISILFFGVTNQSFAQRIEFGLGIESKYTTHSEDCFHNVLKIESLFKERSVVPYLSFGYANYSPGTYNLGYFTAGIGISGYFRSGKTYRPGITLDLNTTFRNGETSKLEEWVFNYYQFVSSSSFKSIPFLFALKTSHVLWAKNIGVELGIGYRHTTLRYNSEIYQFRFKYLHDIEFSLGVKYIFNNDNE